MNFVRQVASFLGKATLTDVSLIDQENTFDEFRCRVNPLVLYDSEYAPLFLALIDSILHNLNDLVEPALLIFCEIH